MSLVATIDGSELPWRAFRENVLKPFKIHCIGDGDAHALPTTLVQQLQAFKNTSNRYDRQREAWKMDMDSRRGLNPSSTILPPNLLPPIHSRSIIQRRMLPRLSREGLPLRTPGTQCSLYELPSPKPMMATALNTDNFSSSEQSHLTGALSVIGTSIDFDKAEVVPGQSSSCPFIIFDKLQSTSEADIEAARNRCAIAGTSCLRGQQQLHQKALGTQRALRDLVTFSCTVNNDYAMLHYHCLGDDGGYLCAPIREFDLRKDDGFNSFQAWMEGIESWACLHLLPSIKATLTEAVKSVITPPTTPPSTTLSIDTNSDDVPLVMKELRQTWPLIPWRRDTGDTPINSSIAQCGTPSFSRWSRLQALASPALRREQTPPGHSMRLQVPLDIRRLSALSPLKTNDLDGSPDSPCRPPSLSPADADPDMPMTARSPILVLTKRLDVASDEIQELRGQVERLQAKLADSDKDLENRVARILNRSSRINNYQYCHARQSPFHLSLYHRRRDDKLDEGYHTNDDDGKGHRGSKSDSNDDIISERENRNEDVEEKLESIVEVENMFFPVIPGSYPTTIEDRCSNDLDLDLDPDFRATAESIPKTLISMLRNHDHPLINSHTLPAVTMTILYCLTAAVPSTFISATLTPVLILLFLSWPTKSLSTQTRRETRPEAPIQDRSTTADDESDHSSEKIAAENAEVETQAGLEAGVDDHNGKAEQVQAKVDAQAQNIDLERQSHGNGKKSGIGDDLRDQSQVEVNVEVNGERESGRLHSLWSTGSDSSDCTVIDDE